MNEPNMLHQFFKFTNNKPTKTDKKDSKTIAEFLEFKQNEFRDNSKLTDERYTLRYFVREKERITKDIAKTKTEVKRILSLLFHEIEKASSVFGKEILSIFFEIGGATKIRRIPKVKFIHIVESLLNKGSGVRSNLCPEKIHQLACSSIAGDYPDYEELLKIKIKRLNSLL